MTLPEIKLFINLGICVVAFNKEFHLLKVTEGLEGKERRPGVVRRNWILYHVFRTSRGSCKFIRQYHSSW